MDDNDELSQLEELLNAEVEDNAPNVTKKSIQEIDLFLPQPGTDDQDLEKDSSDVAAKKSAIHNGDTDSSDDEERRNYTERKYNDYGSGVKKVLDNQECEKNNRRLEFETRLRQSNIEARVSQITSQLKSPDEKVKNTFCVPEAKEKLSADIFTDPVFGIRISKPLISSTSLLDRMQGREAVSMSKIQRFVEKDDISSQDWVVGGVIVRKSDSKKSQKGSQFLIWTLSDLKDDLKTVSMFLFRKAYNELWKTPVGTVVAILNPNVLDRSQNSSDQACLSVDNPTSVMILGKSKDLGICKSKKKTGDPCTAFVNVNQCEHCIYHVKQEYQKFSQRQELQSSTMGKGLVDLKKKVLGKSTVIYGGKAYSALPSGNTKRIKERDQNRLMTLSDYYKSEGDNLMTNKAVYGSGPLFNKTSILHSPTVARKSDSERLSNLTVRSSPTSIAKSIQGTTLKERMAASPKLGKGFSLQGSGTIDLNLSYQEMAAERTKANAIKLIKLKGGLSKVDPHNTKGTEAGKKRALEKLNTSLDTENDCKKSKTSTEESLKPKAIMSDRFKKILEASSAHQNLIEQHDDEEQNKYFSKLEKKEAMEEKMLNTFKIECKAVRCVKCKYTAFSASPHCKEERHPLKVIDSFKRFFKCGDCGNRTVSLELLPMHSCSNCKSSKWEKAPMMREKKVTTLSDGLSIRGEEESFVGGLINKGKNINLLVPDTGA